MSKSQEQQKEEFQLALYLLNKRFNRPIDLLKYWSFAGPCIEEHPSIEDYKKND
jgi:hypothetical protein